MEGGGQFTGETKKNCWESAASLGDGRIISMTGKRVVYLWKNTPGRQHEDGEQIWAIDGKIGRELQGTRGYGGHRRF